MSLATAVLLLLLFGLDLAIGIPFQKANWLMDLIFVLCSLGLAYISWTTYKEVR